MPNCRSIFSDPPWELMQIDNCGSALETEAGWLVLTHGVGAMRNYGIGAALLDRLRPPVDYRAMRCEGRQ